MNEFHSIKECYLHNLKKVLLKGSPVVDERGQTTRELTNLISVINFDDTFFNDPKMENITGSIWKGEKLKTYCEQFLNPDCQGFVYTYGERLNGYFDDVNQIQQAIKRLKDCTSTRRATCVTLDPEVDAFVDEIPCLIMLDFKVRKGGLECTAVFRSNDVYGASYANLHGIYHVMEYVAGEVGVPVSKLVLHQVSAHVYEHDVNSAISLLDANGVNPYGFR